MRLEAVILPDLGTGPDVADRHQLLVRAPGDSVWEGDRLVEVLVGPATFDVPAPASGRLVAIRGREDDRVEPGAVLGLVAAVRRAATTRPTPTIPRKGGRTGRSRRRRPAPRRPPP